jgi:PEGA domain
MITTKRWTVALALAAAIAGAPLRQARAQDANLVQAREHYGLGVDYFDREDYGAAADQFRRAYELVDKPVVVYNLGLSLEKLGRHVEALDALEKALTGRAQLKPNYVAVAERRVAELLQQIGQITISCNVAGAEVLVDGAVVGAAPLAKAIRVPRGRVLVSGRAKQHLTAYQTITAASGQQTIRLELVEASKPLAQVEVFTKLPAAELYVDGQLVAMTPLKSTVGVEADKSHRFELRRAGYLPAVDTLTLGEGASAQITLEPQEDSSQIGSSGGRLQLELSQADATVYVDGQRKDFGTAALPMAAGLHVVRAERSGYEPLARRVVVAPGQTTSLGLDMPPNPETRADLIANAELDGRLGWGFTISGAVVAGVGTGLFIWNRSGRSDALDREQMDEQNTGAFTGCGGMGQMDEDIQRCTDLRTELNDDLNRTLAIDVASVVSMGLGAVGLGTGIYFLASGDDPDQYRLVVDDDVFALKVTPGLVTTRTGAMLTFTGELGSSRF